MIMKYGPFDSVSGNASSSRILAAAIIAVALLIAFFLAVAGREDVVKAAGAIAIQFPAMVGPVLIHMYKNKQAEIGHAEIGHAENSNLINNEQNPTE